MCRAVRSGVRADGSYGFQTTTKLRLVLSVALVDAAIKDSDVVSVFRALHNLMLRVIANPFLSLPPTFHATPAPRARHTEESMAGLPPRPEAEAEPAPGSASADSGEAERETTARAAGEREGAASARPLRNEPTPQSRMFRADPGDIRPAWFESERFRRGVAQLGQLLNGRA